MRAAVIHAAKDLRIDPVETPAVGDGEVIVDADDAAKTLARRAGADGVIETEKGGRRFAIVEVTVGAVKTGTEQKDGRVEGWKSGTGILCNP